MSFWNDLGRGVLAVGTLGVSEGFQPGGIFNPTQPKPQDLTGAAEKQAQANQAGVAAQTQANRPNQTNAFGSSVNWNQGPNGQWTMSQGFGGPLGGVSSGLQQQMANSFGSPMGTGDQARTQAIDSMYGQATSRLDPQWKQRESDMRNQLLNQGLDQNSEAYTKAMANLGRERNDAYGSAMNNAIGMGNQAQQMTFGQNMMARQMPLQNLLQMQGLLNMPGFQGAGMAQGPDYLAAQLGQNNFDMGLYDAKMRQAGDIMGAAGSLGGAVLGR